MLLNINEIFDLFVMSFIIGYIFKDSFKRLDENYEPLARLNRIDFESIKFTVLVTAPAIILHELAHKFVAICYGLEATFHAAYLWLGFGLLLKMMNFGFIFFVPGYVSINCKSLYCHVTPLQSALIAGAGPFMNLLLWLVSSLLLKQKLLKKRYFPVLFITSRINMFLFFFNMLPFFMFDGYKFFEGIIRSFI